MVQTHAPAMTQKTYELLFEQALDTLRSGRCVILDATFSKVEHRNTLKRLLNAEGCPGTWIEAHASDHIVCERLLERDHATAMVSDARFEDYQRLNAGYEPPQELLPSEKISILTDAPLAQVLDMLTSDLVVRQPFTFQPA